MSNDVNQKFVPVEMTREQYATLSGAENYPFGKIKIGTRYSFGILVPAENEEQYREFIHDTWNEEKRKERQQRCTVRSEKSNKSIRCDGICENCERMRDGAPLSLDELFEKNEYEVSDYRQSLQSIDTLVLFEQLLALLKKQSPILAQIFMALYNEIPQREIAKEIGIPHSTATDLIKKMRIILQNNVSKEDITA